MKKFLKLRCIYSILRGDTTIYRAKINMQENYIELKGKKGRVVSSFIVFRDDLDEGGIITHG